MKKVFHKFWVAALVCVCAFGFVLSAQPAHAAGNFTIENYDIDMQVQEDDTYLITETIDVHFTASSHGIYRDIPYRVHLDRDGQVSTFYGKVRDFQMLSGQPVDKTKGDTDYFFKIGDPDRYAQTDTTYKLSYVFDMRGDHLKDADEVYYNLVGTSWEAKDIKHVTCTITFPEDIDMSKVGFKTGNQTAVPFEADGKRVLKVDTTEDVLGGLTVRAVLPEGYFTRQASSPTLLLLILTGILAVLTALGFAVWRRHGKDPAIIETEEFYPPEGLSAPEVCYLENGALSRTPVTSLLLTLADKGYLKITEQEVAHGRKKKKTKTEYEITRLKEYDGDSEDERVFMDGLFMDDEDTVAVKDLKNSFYETIDEIIENIESRYEDRLWDTKAHSYAWALRIAGFLGMVALFVFSKILNGSPFIVGDGDFMVYCVFALMEILAPVIGFYGITKWINKTERSAVGLVVGFIGWSILVLLGLGLALLFDTCMGAQFLPYVLGMGMVFLLFLMAALCERKTDEYASLLGKIRGYKRFLQIAEKDRMEMLAEEDPNYFYRNLAFAFALGVTAVYMKRFAALAAQAPAWYDSPYYTGGSFMDSEGGGIFDPSHLMDSFDNMMDSVSSSMSSAPSSDGGGGGSFSGGGGAGGGGGGSW